MNSLKLLPFTSVVALIFLHARYISAAPTSQVSASVCLTCTVQCPTCEGQWSEWGPWSDCTFQYGVWGKTRERTCIGTSCEGARDEAIQCSPPTTTTTLAPPVWGGWCAWSACSASCGGGIQSRTRQCIKVAGQTMDCVGASTEQRNCNPQPCCEWGQWSAWSSCSVTCGEGLSVRNRQCSCSQGCQGESMQQQTCAGPSCQPACDPGCGSTCCSVTVNCAVCLPSQPCASTCFSGTSSSVPIIGADNVPVIGSTVPTINAGSLPVIGASNLPHITARSVHQQQDYIPEISWDGSEKAIPEITPSNNIPQINANNVPQISVDNIPVIGETVPEINSNFVPSSTFPPQTNSRPANNIDTSTVVSESRLSTTTPKIQLPIGLEESNPGLQIGTGATYNEPLQAVYNPYNNMLWER